MLKFIEEKIAIPLMLFLAVSVLAIIFWWVQNLDTSFEDSVPEVNTEKQDEFANGFDELTADWQTYRNEEFGFEFKYPEEWGVYDPRIIGEEGFGGGSRFSVSNFPSDSSRVISIAGASLNFIWETEYTGFGDFGYKVDENGEVLYGYQAERFERPQWEICNEEVFERGVYIEFCTYDFFGPVHPHHVIVNLENSELQALHLKIDAVNNPLSDKEVEEMKEFANTVKEI